MLAVVDNRLADKLYLAERHLVTVLVANILEDEPLGIIHKITAYSHTERPAATVVVEGVDRTSVIVGRIKLLATEEGGEIVRFIVSLPFLGERIVVDIRSPL